jgi:hypothetical protein
MTLTKRLAGATRRELMLLPLSLCAQTRFPGVMYRDYTRCLPDYLGRLAASARARRLQSFAGLTTAEAVRRRQKWARRTLIDMIGPFPGKTPLNPRTTGPLERDGYRLEKVVYESRPGFPVSANLYIPSGRAAFPGILFQMGLVKQTYARALGAGHTGIRGDEGWNASKWGNVFRIGAKERYESYNNAP